ncbi:MAG: glycosyltransferase [Clostridia bacterium]
MIKPFIGIKIIYIKINKERKKGEYNILKLLYDKKRMEKIKVMFISAANSIHTVKWVNSLSDEFEVHLVYCRNHKPNIDNIKQEVILHELKYKAPVGYYLNMVQLKKIYKNINPNIVNVHYASGYGTLARISNTKPILLSIWGSDVYDFPNESKIKRRILEKNVMKADLIASTSNVMANELKRQFPNLKKEIFITPFGVDIEKFKKRECKREDNDFNIGNIKKLEKKYGIEYLILGVKKLIDKLNTNGEKSLADSIKLYIYGKGNQREELENLVKRNNLSKQVFFMGAIPNDIVPEKLSELDVFCATSILNSESFGVAVVEAMACELPIIATDVDGFSEVMVNNETGYIIERKNIDQIATNIEKLLRDKELRIRFGKNARKRVVENYNWLDNVEYMKEIYMKLIEK